MSAISDIDISYSYIGTKYVGLNPLIPISEEFRYRHQLPFWYWTKSKLDIPISKIDKSFLNDPSKILTDKFLSRWYRTHSLHVEYQALTTALRGFTDIVVGYWTELYSDIRYNVWPSALQLVIGHSDIRLSPISPVVGKVTVMKLLRYVTSYLLF
jgi:hypothetical protein